MSSSTSLTFTSHTLTQITNTHNFASILQYLHEYISHAESAKNGTVDVKIPALTEILPEPLTDAVSQTLLAKALHTCDLLTITTPNTILKNIITFIAKNDIIAPHILRSYLDFKILSQVGLIDKKYHAGWVKYRSQLVFAPERFNLFQEESEGWSRIGVYLLESDLRRDNMEGYVTNLEMTMGAFSLDPSRVVDMLLEVYSMNLHNDVYLDVLERCGAKGHYHKLLGMKFKQYAKGMMNVVGDALSNGEATANGGDNDADDAETDTTADDDGTSASLSATPRRLFQLAAILISKNCMTIGDLLPYIALKPKARAQMMQQFQDEYLKEKFTEAKDLAAASLLDDAITLQSKPYRQELPPLNLPLYYVHNQELQMLGALLQQNALSSAYPLMRRNYELQIYLHPHVASGLISMLQKCLHDVCPSDASFFGVPKKRSYSQEDFNIIRLQIYPLLQYLDVGLGESPSVAIQLARLLVDIVESGYKGELGANHACDDPRNIYFHMVCILFRSRCLMWANSQFSSLVWSIIKTLKYPDRFAVYENLLQGYNDNFLLQQHASVVSKRTNDILKKMTKEDAKVKSRLLVQFIHSNPLVVCERIVAQAQAYENLIDPLSELVRWFHPEAFDAMTYIMLKKLEPEEFRSRLKPDDSTVQNWITNMGTFAGKLMRKYSYSSNQLSPMMKFIYGKFKQTSWEDSSLLIEILKEVVNEELVEDISKVQLQAFAGSRTLQKLAASFQEAGAEVVSETSARESTAKLLRALTEDNVGSDMLIFLSSFSANAPYIFDSEATLTLLSSCKDKVHAAFVSLLRFMLHTHIFEFDEDAMDITDEVKSSTSATVCVPSLNFLRTSRVPTANSFALARPIIKKDLSKVLSFAPQFIPFVDASEAEENGDESQESSHTPSHNVDVWNHMSKELYTIFWSLDLYDIYCPQELYTIQIEKQEEERKTLEERRPKVQRSEDKKKLNAALQVATETMQTLRTDLTTHQARLEEVTAFIQQHVQAMCSTGASAQEFMDAFMQWCVHPRCHFSIIDALYCTKFVEIVARSGDASFSFNVMTYMTEVFKCAPVWLCFDTQMEAVRIGALIESCLAMSNALHRSAPKDKRSVDNATTKSYFLKADDDTFDAQEYNAHFHHELHSQFTKQICAVVQKEGSTHFQRNALLVLNRVADEFPKYQDHAKSLRNIMKKLSKRKLEGILPLIQRYQNKLEKLTPSLLKEPVAAKASVTPKKGKPVGNRKYTRTTAPPPAPNRTQQKPKESPKKAQERRRTSPPPKPIPATTPKSPPARRSPSPKQNTTQQQQDGKDLGGVSFVAKQTETAQKPAARKRERIAPPPSVTEVQKKSMRGRDVSPPPASLIASQERDRDSRSDDRNSQRYNDQQRRFDRYSPQNVRTSEQPSRDFSSRRDNTSGGTARNVDHSPRERDNNTTGGRSFRPASSDRRGSGGWDSRDSRGNKGGSRDGGGSFGNRRSTGDDRDSRDSRRGGDNDRRFSDRRKRSRENDDMSGGRKSYRDNSGRRGYR